MEPIYLDHNATTPLAPEAAAAMDACQRFAYANPSSPHALGRRAKQALEDARESLAELLGAKLTGPAADRLIFTSGGTEANNLALAGLARRDDGPVSLVISALEHPSVTNCARRLAAEGAVVLRTAGVDVTGQVRLEDLQAVLDQVDQGVIPPVAAISVLLGHHETGVLQPVAELVGLCQGRSLALHTDVVQVAGKLPVRFRELGVAALSIAPHKFHGPRGIGILLARGDTPLHPLLFGGPQQEGIRPGTELVTLAVGAQAALAAWERERPVRIAHLQTCRDLFEQELRRGIPGLVIHGQPSRRLPHVSFVAIPGLDRQALLLALDLAGVCCSAGAACQSGASEPSAALVAMGLPPEIVNSSLRFSFGLTNPRAEARVAAEKVVAVAQRLRATGTRVQASNAP